MAWTVLPTPISSANRTLPWRLRAKCTPTCWKGMRAWRKCCGMLLNRSSASASLVRLLPPLHNHITCINGKQLDTDAFQVMMS